MAVRPPIVPDRAPGPAGWGRTLLILAAIFAAAEITTHILVSSIGLADRPVDIQAADTLCAKVERVRRHSGPRIVVLGDSLAYGAALGDQGDKEWRNHDLASAIKAALGSSGSLGSRPLVMNLGLNGGLPADQLAILRMFDGVKLDAVIITTAIRSYATDFAAKGTAHSRPWLADVTTAGLPGCRLRKPNDAAGDAWAAGQFGRISELYRSRGLIQANLFGGSLRDANESMRASFKLRTAKGSPPDLMATLGLGSGGVLQTLMLAKTRFQKISFATPHAQVEATKALITEAGRAATRAVFIYGTENPKVLPQILSNSSYVQARSDLKALFEARPANVAYLDTVKPAPKDYIDYVHVNRDGYRLMAAEIANALGAPTGP